MRAGNIDKVKRRVLQQAVAENLDTMRGLPPRPLRRQQRFARIWARRAAAIALPLALAGSTWVVSNGGASHTPASMASMETFVPRLASRPIPRPATESSVGAERVTSAAFPLAVRRVVLDAGHGGSDPGATATSLMEKEITLDIGRRLQKKLEADGFEVLSTRDADRTIALNERARVANESRSDIFVSIHVNALVKHTASRGIETYYLGPTNDPSLTKLAAAENTVSGYSMADMRKLLDGIYADARRDESHQLASVVQQRLFSTLREIDPALENWGVKRAPFIVLVATEMPAILAEVGCISNQKEVAMLARPEYRQKIADALFEGIRAYSNASDASQKKGIERNG